MGLVNLLLNLRVDCLLLAVLFLIEAPRSCRLSRFAGDAAPFLVIVLAGALLISRLRVCRARCSSGSLDMLAACVLPATVVTFAGVVLSSYGLLSLGSMGLCAALVARDRPELGIRITTRLHVSLAVLLLAVLFVHVLTLLPMEWPTAVAGMLCRPFSGVCAANQGTLIVHGAAIHISRLIPTWALVPIVFAFLLSRERALTKCWKSLLALAMVSGVQLTTAVAALSFSRHEAFLGSSDVLGLMTGWVVALLLWPPGAAGGEEPARQWDITAFWVPVLAASLVLVFPGSPTKGTPRIAVDESHGRWETMLGVFDLASYGRDTAYNYRLLRDWLEAQFSVKLLTEGVADGSADVILVKMPTTYFTATEKAFLRRFVAHGGRLVVIGDHTNLFGTTGVINDLLSWTGMRLNADAVIPLQGKHHDLLPKWWNTVRCDPNIGRVEFQTGASISSVNPLVEPLIVADSVVAEGADYSNDRFFAELTPTLDDRKGPVCMAALCPWGYGDVVLFSDSTIWSNFSFFAVTNERLFASLLRYRSAGWLRWSAAIAVYSLAWSSLYALRKRHTQRRKNGYAAPTFLSGICLVFLVATMAACRISPASLPYVPDKFERVVFDAVHSSVSLRADLRTGTQEDLDDFSTCYAWLSRGGLHPIYEDATPFGRAELPVLILNPRRKISSADAQKALEYVKAGGRLLYLAGPSASDPGISEAFLAGFGISMRLERVPGGLYDANGIDIHGNFFALPLDLLSNTRALKGTLRMGLGRTGYALGGVTPLAVDDDGLVVLGEKTLGSGRITVFLQSTVLSEFFFGDVWGGKDTAPGKVQAYEFFHNMVSHACRSP